MEDHDDMEDHDEMEGKEGKGDNEDKNLRDTLNVLYTATARDCVLFTVASCLQCTDCVQL